MSTMAAFITAIHLAALSQIESGDRDTAVGRFGEVSRYQVSPSLWLHCTQRAGGITLPTDEKAARIVAYDIWESRVSAFRMKHHRNPTVQETYLLWHRPSRVMNPRAAERERAQRFENIYNALQQKKAHGTGK